MGCDIHMVLERRDYEKNRWVGIDSFCGHQSCLGDRGYSWSIARSRNYARFAKLAGVRGDGPEPRGVPDDISETTDFLIRDWDGDGHSHSWLMLSDAVPIFLETAWPDPEPDSFTAKYPASYFFGVESEKLDDYRLIFWFDN